ncbi:GAF domain-containing protein [Parashewanella spongiae]|uniref:GAF domain-containing protein n=1 Tax=Parashewanella spongiae TaxID=342950 RepID=A0A3A6TLA7_9GAMM|nr:GAF domain-containing protein [Parashewanella spongiae]MCL1078482.1 GAF domain-containing protein [Parashewanella spongiae]RJY14665.1 GAF domain-containing protein [Parashewanella spongiae]
MKSELYDTLNRQVLALFEGETDLIAAMANLSALLNEHLSEINWVGFYLAKNDELVLGPFQGKVACVRIPMGRGVCGTAAAENKIQRIADVHQFKGHIACDSASNSEIVIPVIQNDKVIAVLDIDSPNFSRFDEQDQNGLETIVESFEKCLFAQQMHKI